MKKLLSFILAIATLVTLFCFPMNAEGESTAFFYGNTISLHSSLKYTIFAQMTEAEVKDASVTFTMNGKTSVATPSKATNYGDGIYRFDFNGIAPQMIGADITSELKIGTTTVDTHTGSIVEYCNAAYEPSADTALNRILIDVISYGKAARAYIIEKNSLGESAIPAISQISGATESNYAITAKPLTVVTPAKSGEPFINSAAVHFDSTNSLLFVIKTPDGWKGDISDYRIYTDSTACEEFGKPNSLGEYYCYSTPISAANFNKEYTVSLKDADGNVVHSIKYGISTYASRKASGEGTMADLAKATYYYADAADKYVKLAKTYLNGKSVIDYVIVADEADSEAAESINSAFESKYGAELKVVPIDSYEDGNAIIINDGNSYGGVRYGIDSDVDNNGSVQIHIDGLSSHTDKMVNTFVSQLPAISGSATINDDLHYQFTSDSKNNGYLLKNSTSVEREIIDGVRYIERTYTVATVESGSQNNASNLGKKNTMYIIILEADAKAHLEVQNAEYTNVRSCSNSTNCDKKHINSKLTTAEFAENMENGGKNVLAATNAGYFMLSAGCNTPWGMQIVEGVVKTEPRTVSSSAKNYQGWFEVTKDGTPIISSSASDYNTNYKGRDIIYYGVGGRRELFIEDGIFNKSNYSDIRTRGADARLSIGYNANGDIVIIVADGNDANVTSCPGATSNDMAQIFMDLDMDITHVLWLDGGGSTTVMVENSNGILTQENTVNGNSDSNGDGIYDNQRPLSDIIAIVAD